MSRDHYYNGIILFPKPALTIEADGNVVTDILNVTPSSTVNLVLVAAVPDEHTVDVFETAGMQVSVLESPVTLTFYGGRSGSVQLQVPPQGVSSVVQWTSKYVQTFELVIRGWA